MHHSIFFPGRRMKFLSHLLDLHAYVCNSRYYTHGYAWTFLNITCCCFSAHVISLLSILTDVISFILYFNTPSFSFHTNLWNFDDLPYSSVDSILISNIRFCIYCSATKHALRTNNLLARNKDNVSGLFYCCICSTIRAECHVYPRNVVSVS